MPNLMKDDVVTENTFPSIINWFFTFASYANFLVMTVKNGC